jgi:predicted permease
MGLGDDLRVVFRRLRQQPAFTLVVVLTLALGLGANIANFALVDALLLRSLPVDRPEELYRLGDTNDCCVNSGLPSASFSLFSFSLFEHLRANVPELVDVAGFQANQTPVALRRPGAPVAQSLPGQFVTANYFRMLGVTPAAGRLLHPDDDRPGAPPVVVLSHRAWARFGLDPSVVGGSILVNGTPMTVVGITPQAFFGDTIRPNPPAVWMPLGQERAMRAEGSLLDRPDQHWLYAIGRLAPSVRPGQASSRATSALQQWLSAQTFLSSEDRRRLPQQHIVVAPAGGGVPIVQTQFSRSLSLLFLTSAVLLLIATANLANLLLARADRGQAAIRAALGASTRRLIQLSMIEGVVLALLGAAGGAFIAAIGARALIALAFPAADFVPFSAGPSLSAVVFSGALAVVTGVLFTAAPAWAMSRTPPLDALAGTGRDAHSRSFLPRRSLVIAQVALSFAMLTCAMLLAGSLRNLERQELGFDPLGRQVVLIDPPGARAADAAQLAALYRRLQERLRREPGIAAVTYALYSPMEGNNWSSGISIAGRTVDPARPDGSSWNRVGPGYFETTGTRILQGRAIDERDVPGAHRVAVVNASFARRFFGDANPLGSRLGIGDASHSGDFEIVGVADDVKYINPRQPVRPMIFLPAFQTVDYADASSRNVQARSMRLRAIVLQTRPGATSLEPVLRSAIAEVDPDINVLRIVPMPEQVSGNFRIERLLARLTTIYGALALILAALGLYGVTSSAVAQRTREIGVRMALGAARAGIVKTVVRGPLVHTLIGLLLGGALALAVGGVLGTQLYGLGGRDPRFLLAGAAILIATAALASAIPARRAASIDPARALRCQ